jgi:DNA-binding HxlR family transcriptional regulator
MAGKRSYDDGCAAAHALDLIGERWALLVVRELALGPKRFTDLRIGLPGISPNVLTQRLQDLEAASIVIRRKLPPPAAVGVYQLTDWGLELEPVIRDIGRWAARSPQLPRDRPMSVNSFILSLRTMFDPDAAAGLEAKIDLRLDDQSFRAGISGGRLDLPAAGSDPPDGVLAGDPNALAAVIYGGQKLGDAVRAGDIRIEGDRGLIKRFVTLFPLPEPAPAAWSGT